MKCAQDYTHKYTTSTKDPQSNNPQPLPATPPRVWALKQKKKKRKRKEKKKKKKEKKKKKKKKKKKLNKLPLGSTVLVPHLQMTSLETIGRKRPHKQNRQLVPS